MLPKKFFVLFYTLFLKLPYPVASFLMAFSYILSGAPLPLPPVAPPPSSLEPSHPSTLSCTFISHVLMWECAEVKTLERPPREDKNRKGSRTHVTCKNFCKVALDERLANGALSEGRPIV